MLVMFISLALTWGGVILLGDRIAVRFESGILKLPVDPSTPLIMVGPGTGVAPFRSLMEERKSSGARSQLLSYLLANCSYINRIFILDNLLFFGCRSESADYHYKDEWRALVESGHLTLSVAASRDQVRSQCFSYSYFLALIPRQIWLGG